MTQKIERSGVGTNTLALLVLDLMALIFIAAMFFFIVLAFINSHSSLKGWEFGIAAILWVCPMFAAWLFHLILQDARYRDPFTHLNVKRLNLMGHFLLWPWVLTTDWTGLFNHLTSQRVELNVFSPGEFSVKNLVLSLLLFGLAGVFARGVALREEQELTV